MYVRILMCRFIYKKKSLSSCVDTYKVLQCNVTYISCSLFQASSLSCVHTYIACNMNSSLQTHLTLFPYSFMKQEIVVPFSIFQYQITAKRDKLVQLVKQN